MQRFLVLGGAACVLILSLLGSDAAFIAAVAYALYVLRPKNLLIVSEIPDVVLAPAIFLVLARAAVAAGSLKVLGFPFVHVLALTAISCVALYLSRKLEKSFGEWFLWAVQVLFISAFFSAIP